MDEVSFAWWQWAILAALVYMGAAGLMARAWAKRRERADRALRENFEAAKREGRWRHER